MSDLYDIARQVTDEVLGAGTYAEVNAGNPNPGVQAAIQRAPKQRWVVLIGDNPIHYQPGTDEYDGVDDLEVRGPFDTEQAARDYAMNTSRYVCQVIPLNEPVPDR